LPVVYRYLMTISSWGLNAAQAEAVFNFANCGVLTRIRLRLRVPFSQF
jgi:hypothetical protein